MRLTIKPGVERACTATLPQLWARANTSAAICGAVCRPDTTSTSFISGTGLKKCMPTRRSGWRRPCAMAVIDMDEVLLANTQSAPTMPSNCSHKARLASTCSTMASTTSVLLAASCKLATGVMRASRPATAAACILPLATKAPRLACSLSSAPWAAPSRMSYSHTGCPACAATCAIPAPMMPAPTTSTRGFCRPLMVRVPRGRGVCQKRRQSPRAPRGWRAPG